jgi:hypothetical protein
LQARKERVERSFLAKFRMLPRRHASKAIRFGHAAVQDLSKFHPGACVDDKEVNACSKIGEVWQRSDLLGDDAPRPVLPDTEKFTPGSFPGRPPISDLPKIGA